GVIYLFGGTGVGSDTVSGDLNDLWKFDGTNWVWVSGIQFANSPPVYGTQGVSAPNNMPGARHGAVLWVDHNNRVWLFGGQGINSNGQVTTLNDMWSFDGNAWTWMSGSTTGGGSGIYRVPGQGSPTVFPGSRVWSQGWADANGRLWLFGGY